MLEQIDLRLFKCFEQLSLPIKRLTLLTGTNASGKSSVLQALVLLQQTMREHEWSKRLMLNGESLQLGTVADVVDKVNGRRELEIGVADDTLSARWCFNGEREDMAMALESCWLDAEKLETADGFRFLLPQKRFNTTPDLVKRIRNLTYITAERVGPREIYALCDRQLASVVGSSGKHAASVLHWGRDEPVLEPLRIANIPNNRLRQVEAHMREFFPGFGMELRQIPQANSVMLGLRTADDTNFHRPIHVGFGLTQVFPIVVAALSAQSGDILLIENPEVHLHPAGQVYMGQFLSKVAAAGVQVILESHSDHVLNGVRRSVKQQMLAASDVAIHFFRARVAISSFHPPSENKAQVESPQLDSQGNIDYWPEGFFDQFDKDMNYFAGWEDMDVISAE